MVNSEDKKQEKKPLLPFHSPSTPTKYSQLKGSYHSYQDGGTRSRQDSLCSISPRLRSDSLTIYNDDGDDVTNTSFGPVIMDEHSVRTDWLLGWFLAIISGVLFTANNFFVKYLTIDPIEMLLMRSGLQAVVLTIIIMSTNRKFLPDGRLDKILVMLQGLASGMRIFLQFACLSYMPLGDALTLVFTEPLWTILLSRLVLSISIGVWKIVFGCVLVGGMILCIQPPVLFSSQQDSLTASEDSPGYYVGAILAISTAVTGSLANVIIAKCERVSSTVMVFFSGVGGVVLALVFSIFDQDNTIVFNPTVITWEQWGVLVVLGGMGIIGYFSMTRSLQLIPPTTVAVLRAMEIILAYIIQAVVMGEVPDTLAITGSTLVMFSVVAFALEDLICGCF